ncbi:hypothetical protein [Succinimonas sp.]|uniref:hypothetical protein n=1 Tax=Succinimonas sp. TaxID=1936151 RepID=UPI00386F3FB9
MNDLTRYLEGHKKDARYLLEILQNPLKDPGIRSRKDLLQFLGDLLPNTVAAKLERYQDKRLSSSDKSKLFMELGLKLQDFLRENGITPEYLEGLASPENRIANAGSGDEKRSDIRTSAGRVFVRAGAELRYRDTAFGGLAGMPFFPEGAQFAGEISRPAWIIVVENQAVFLDFEELTALSADTRTQEISEGYPRTLFVQRIMPKSERFSQSEYCHELLYPLLQRFPEIPVVMAGDPDPGGINWMRKLYRDLTGSVKEHRQALPGGALFPVMTENDWETLRENGKELVSGTRVFDDFERLSRGDPDNIVTALAKRQFQLRKTITEEYLRARKIPLRLYSWEELGF